MTLKTQLVVDLEFTSDCSEADLHSHIQGITSQLKHRIKDIPNESWNRHVNVSWDESFQVDSYVKITESKIE